jgi:CDP-paratose 2-epimerase
MRTKLLIIGGAGFIGSNLASHFAQKNYEVTIFDNFMRFGTRDNVRWLKNKYPHIMVTAGDIRNMTDLKKVVKDKDVIFHLAAQVAVTTSVTDPRTDFEINALGSFNVLEAIRLAGHKPIAIFSSTNKVYGNMEDTAIVERKDSYAYKNLPDGVSEKNNLDFHSPYGCSKGTADCYFHDYERIYDIPTVVFRQSCIYGPRQFGIEDQGWIAWFIIAETLGKPITIYGDGKQVRDVLYIDDLVRLFETAVNKIKTARGKIYNVGGGTKNTLSVWSQFGPILEDLFGRKIHVAFGNWRPGDQKVYVSDIRLVRKELGWEPKIKVRDGIKKLFNWVQENKSLFKNFMK